MELGARPAALGCAPGLHCLLPRHPGPACATPPLDLARPLYAAADPVGAPRSHACRVSCPIAPTAATSMRVIVAILTAASACSFPAHCATALLCSHVAAAG
ncbi:hypothetical protein E2562_000115 [Oryza meyeriana var. granulata]|uniref:Uncharacterized protein n=1 Tax=Oryza meyeriana var. granulata TaxID=110450 RepID=A0A6G1DC98_9ORYZ|nr:hypothetical protein E2562_000115 [Oryza meyeriana var. granulata]